MKKIKQWMMRYGSLSGMSVVGMSLVAHAATFNTPPSPVKNVNDLENVLCTFIGYFFWIVMTISVIMILYAAFTYVTARDDQEKTSRARRTITYAAIGIAVALLSIGFPNIVASFFPSNNVTLQLQCTVL